jgi:DNA-binding response OmpR family regulator
VSDRPPRILLVDDEQPIQTLLSFPLQRDGYEVIAASDGQEALARFAEQPFDLVVLDLMLPKVDGLEVCKRLRARSAVPIIMLTAKSEEIDKVLGLELGADDYITKPFSMREFRSRVKAALRRAGMARAHLDGDTPIEVRELRIDPAKRDPRTVDVHIRHLREKLEADAKEPEYVFTVRGVGYRFRDEE